MRRWSIFLAINVELLSCCQRYFFLSELKVVVSCIHQALWGIVMNFSCNRNGVVMLIFRQVKFFEWLIFDGGNLRDPKGQNFLKASSAARCMLCDTTKRLWDVQHYFKLNTSFDLMRCCYEYLFPLLLGQFFGLLLPNSLLVRSAGSISTIKASPFDLFLGLVLVRVRSVLRAEA